MIAFLLVLVLAGCGSSCGESFVVDATTVTDDEQLVDQACFTEDTAGYDLSGCCPDGYEAVGFDVSGGGVVCVGRCL
jgi:hypothetical protein